MTVILFTALENAVQDALEELDTTPLWRLLRRRELNVEVETLVRLQVALHDS
jgi:hypothetical protein